MQPFDIAWNLLKGNPEMKDAHGQNIDQPAAALYGNLAAGRGALIDSALPVRAGMPVMDIERRLASALTQAQMQQADPQHGRNYGIERQDRHEVEHPNKPSRVEAILEALERRGGDDPNNLASESQLRMARQEDAERDFGDKKYPLWVYPDPYDKYHGTDVQMQPGNVMDLM